MCERELLAVYDVPLLRTFVVKPWLTVVAWLLDELWLAIYIYALR